MIEKNYYKIRRQLKLRMFITILLSLIFSMVLISDVRAQGQTVTVRLVIEQSSWNGCDDPFSPPDVFWDVFIDGIRQSTFNDPIEVNIAPFNVDREFLQVIDISVKQNIAISIHERDDDNPDDNDTCDIDPGSGENLDLNLDLVNCQISGDVSGECDTSIDSMASIGDKLFKFRIIVDYPVSSDGLSLRTLHNPIWPQPGDSITISAEALDGNANPMAGIVDNIEIWIDDTDNPVATTATTPGSFGSNVLSFNYTPAADADQILYRSRVYDNGAWISSGWRIVQIGQPARGRAVPILYTGVQHNRLDFVFIADIGDYPGGANDINFLADVRSVINNAYYGGNASIRDAGRLFLSKQDALNFWVALDTGDAVPACTNCTDPANCRGCDPHVLPNKWNRNYMFADVGVILHRTAFRDFAMPGKPSFSSEPYSPWTVLHETGHQPFGLADEYCCDGGYFQTDLYPNIYELNNLSDCQNDPLAQGVTNSCQQINDPWTGVTEDWRRLESASTLGNDLMEDSGQHTPRPADEQRIYWLFDECRSDEGC